jgi:hypothetical protein
MAVAQHKRGDTFDYSGTASASENGVAVTDFTGWVGACQIRDRDDALIAALTFSWLDEAAGLMRVRSTSDTNGWRVGRAKIDVQFTSPSGAVVSTATQEIDIVVDVTR